MSRLLTQNFESLAVRVLSIIDYPKWYVFVHEMQCSGRVNEKSSNLMSTKQQMNYSLLEETPRPLPGTLTSFLR